MWHHAQFRCVKCGRAVCASQFNARSRSFSEWCAWCAWPLQQPYYEWVEQLRAEFQRANALSIEALLAEASVGAPTVDVSAGDGKNSRVVCTALLLYHTYHAHDYGPGWYSACVLLPDGRLIETAVFTPGHSEVSVFCERPRRASPEDFGVLVTGDHQFGRFAMVDQLSRRITTAALGARPDDPDGLGGAYPPRVT